MEKLVFIENDDGQEMDSVTCESMSDCQLIEQQQMRQRLQEIIDEAPSDANIKVFLRKMKDGYRGLLRVASSQGEFESRITAKKVTSVLEQLCNSVEKQIFSWRSKRVQKIGS